MVLGFNILLVVAAAAAVVVSHVAYRRTTPALSRRLSIFLSGLRAVSYLLIVFLLTDPRFVRHSEKVEPAAIIGLIDQSQSMSLPARGWGPNAGPSRFDEARDVERRIKKVVESKGAVFIPAYFSGGRVLAEADTVIPNGQGTDIRGALREAVATYEGRNVAGIVLISDGVDTEERLVREPGPSLPVYAIGLGDTLSPEDVRIKDVDYSSIVNVPSRSAIKTVVDYSGGPAAGGGTSKRVRLRLREGERSVFERDTVLVRSPQEWVQEIPIEFKEPGKRRFTLDVVVQGYDAEDDNNRRDIVIDAEKSGRRILIVDLAPTWELTFLTGLLRREPSFDFGVVTTPAGHPAVSKDRIVPRGDFARRLAEYDALVIASLDSEALSESEAAAITKFVRDDRKGLLVLPGPASLFETPAAWARLAALLPVQATPPVRFNLKYTTLRPGPHAASHPITSPLVAVLSQTPWQQRSPLLGWYAPLAPKPGSEILLETEESRAPALVQQAVGGGRVVLMASGPLWRWKFLAEDASVYDQLVSRILDFVSRGGQTERFLLRAGKNVYDSGEPAIVTGEVFDERMQPVTGVPVRVEISRADDGGDVPLDVLSMQREGSDNTRFRATLPPMGPGRYRIRGEADLTDRKVVSLPLDITVSDVSVEFQRVSQDRSNLEMIAATSGGFYMGENSIDDFTKRAELSPTRTPTTSEVALRTSFAVFAAIIVLLSVEWIIRKRVGMI
jgi:hypothetical protein